jgi:hypothetical protein
MLCFGVFAAMEIDDAGLWVVHIGEVYVDRRHAFQALDFNTGYLIIS